MEGGGKYVKAKMEGIRERNVRKSAEKCTHSRFTRGRDAQHYGSAVHELLLLSWAAASQRRARSPAIQVRTAPHILPAHLAPHTWLGRGLP